MALIALETGLAELRALLGTDLPRHAPWAASVTPEAIRQFALGASATTTPCGATRATQRAGRTAR